MYLLRDDRSQRHRHLHGGRVLQPRHVQPDVPRRSSASRRRSSAQRGPLPGGAVVLREGVDADRAVSEKRPTQASAYVRGMFNAHHAFPDLRPRPGRSARLLRRQARARGRHRPGPRLHALAHRAGARRPGAARSCSRSPARPSMDDADRRRRSASCSTKGAMGGWLCFTTDDAHKTYDELKAQGRRHHRRADRPAVRHRLRHPRPVRQRHPHRPDVPPGLRTAWSGSAGYARASRP